jgi:hypothetical protein
MYLCFNHVFLFRYIVFVSVTVLTVLYLCVVMTFAIATVVEYPELQKKMYHVQVFRGKICMATEPGLSNIAKSGS